MTLYKTINFWKQKIHNKNKYYNLYQKGYYNRDCQFLD